MKAQTNRSIIDNSLQRKLRNDMTDAENCLWRRLRGRQIHGYKFRRQHPYMDYVLDFVCLEKQLILEVDGGQHLESEQDRIRDGRLSAAGFRILRFWNNQVLQDTEAVVEMIWSALQEESEKISSPSLPHPPPSLPLEGGGANHRPPLVPEGHPCGKGGGT
jgi:very-short-patch-repair endonuclease